jgi:hypothetical protein
MKDGYDEIVRLALSRRVTTSCDSLEDGQVLVELGLHADDVLAVALEFARIAGRDFPLALLDLVETVGELTGLVRAWAGSDPVCGEDARLAAAERHRVVCVRCRATAPTPVRALLKTKIVRSAAGEFVVRAVDPRGCRVCGGTEVEVLWGQRQRPACLRLLSSASERRCPATIRTDLDEFDPPQRWVLRRLHRG